MAGCGIVDKLSMIHSENCYARQSGESVLLDVGYESMEELFIPDGVNVVKILSRATNLKRIYGGKDLEKLYSEPRLRLERITDLEIDTRNENIEIFPSIINSMSGLKRVKISKKALVLNNHLKKKNTVEMFEIDNERFIYSSIMLNGERKEIRNESLLCINAHYGKCKEFTVLDATLLVSEKDSDRILATSLVRAYGKDIDKETKTCSMIVGAVIRTKLSYWTHGEEMKDFILSISELEEIIRDTNEYLRDTGVHLSAEIEKFSI